MHLPQLPGATLRTASKQLPASLVTGARESARTTFLPEELGAGRACASLDDPLERAVAREAPNGFPDRFGDAPPVFDEILVRSPPGTSALSRNASSRHFLGERAGDPEVAARTCGNLLRRVERLGLAAVTEHARHESP